MSTAPGFRAVDALSGALADRPSKFMDALSEADRLIAELDELHELRTRVAELEGALRIAREYADHAAEQGAQLRAERDELRERADDYRFERNSLASDLADLREAHMVTVSKLATANAAVSRYERQGW